MQILLMKARSDEMPELNLEAEIYFVHYICDECGVGEMKPSDSDMLLTDPPKYLHECGNSKCGSKSHLNERYPVIRIRHKR